MTGGSPEVVILATAADVASAAADRIAVLLTTSVARRGTAQWATTGGSAPPAIYAALLARERSSLPWDRIGLWVGDERYVPRTDPLSNARLVDVSLSAAAGGPLPATNIHAWPTDEALTRGLGPDWCAARLADIAVTLLPTDHGVPVFDLVVVGVGPDGHILSVFPASAPFPPGLVTAAVPGPTHVEPRVPRVTFTPRIVDVARAVLVVAHGREKAAAMAAALAPHGDSSTNPARRAARAGATWLIDTAAAAGIGGSLPSTRR